MDKKAPEIEGEREALNGTYREQSRDDEISAVEKPMNPVTPRIDADIGTSSAKKKR